MNPLFTRRPFTQASAGIAAMGAFTPFSERAQSLELVKIVNGPLLVRKMLADGGAGLGALLADLGAQLDTSESDHPPCCGVSRCCRC